MYVVGLGIETLGFAILLKNAKEKLIFFINKKSIRGEPNYAKFNMKNHALLHVVRCLKPCFQGIIVKAFIAFPMNKILNND